MVSRLVATTWSACSRSPRAPGRRRNRTTSRRPSKVSRPSSPICTDREGSSSTASRRCRASSRTRRTSTATSSSTSASSRTALVSQLVSVPLPSPASGFTYHFDPSLGVFQRTTQSFGPILADRAETIGAAPRVGGLRVPALHVRHRRGARPAPGPGGVHARQRGLLGGREDVVTTTNAIEAKRGPVDDVLTLGITDHFDVSVAMPVVSNSLKVVSDATIHRLGTTNELTHFFRQSDGDVGDAADSSPPSAARPASGDLMVRLKGTLCESARPTGVAVGLDMRLPTGDEMNLLGSGTAGLQPFAHLVGHVLRRCRRTSMPATSGTARACWPAIRRAASLRIFRTRSSYAAGADMSVNSRLTLAFDLLGRLRHQCRAAPLAAVPRARRPLRIPEHRVREATR